MTGPDPTTRGSEFCMPFSEELLAEKLLAGRQGRRAQWRVDRATGLSHSQVRFPPDSPPSPYGCRWCGRPAGQHGVVDWVASVGFHSWTRPTPTQAVARMQARRRARAKARRVARLHVDFERAHRMVGPCERRRLRRANAVAPRPRVCDEMNHDGRGHETFCQEDPHDRHPVHDDGHGTTWDRED